MRIMEDQTSNSNSNKKKATPLNSFTGALISATLAVLLYRLTQSIVLSFAAHPTLANSQFSQTLSSAVRTLVIGLSTMATGLSALATLGLVALGIQLLLTKASTPDQEP